MYKIGNLNFYGHFTIQIQVKMDIKTPELRILDKRLKDLMKIEL